MLIKTSGDFNRYLFNHIKYTLGVKYKIYFYNRNFLIYHEFGEFKFLRLSFVGQWILTFQFRKKLDWKKYIKFPIKVEG